MSISPIIFDRIWAQGSGVRVETMPGTAFTEEARAHLFRIAGKDADGNNVQLSGTVLAKFLRADNQTIDIDGTVTNGVVNLTLVGDCYNVPGRFSLVIYLSDGTATAAIYACVGTVYRGTSGQELDSGTTVPSLAQLEAAYQNALDAANAANTARQGLQDVAFLGMNGATAITVDSDPAVTTDLNDFRTPGVYYAPSSVASAANMLNCPVKANFRMFVVNLNNGQIVNQIIIQRANNSVWMRNYTLSWTQWARLNTTSDPTVRGYGSAIDASNFGDNLTDADNAVPGVVYFLNQCINTENPSKGWSAIAHTPESETGKSGFLVSAAGAISTNNKQSLIQLLFMTNDHIWYRRQVTNNWSNWIQLNEFFAETEINRYYVNTCVDRLKTKLTSSDKFVVFGDSIATGSWVSNFRSAIGISSGNAVKKAVSGAVWGHTSSLTEDKWISTQVAGMTSANWANVKLVILAAGTNDADYSSSISTSEIRTQVQAVIDTIKTAAPNAHMLFITPIRRGEEEKMKKLPAIAGAIANVALENGCSVINGFDIPIPANGITDVVDKLTSDAVHPTDIGHEIYARAVIGFTQ